MSSTTTNLALTENWQLIAEAAQGFLLSLPTQSQAIELALGSTDASPAHRYAGRPELLNRAHLGEGALYARAQGDSATITLTTWTIQ
jgi:hypothetical protein